MFGKSAGPTEGYRSSQGSSTVPDTFSYPTGNDIAETSTTTSHSDDTYTTTKTTTYADGTDTKTIITDAVTDSTSTADGASGTYDADTTTTTDETVAETGTRTRAYTAAASSTTVIITDDTGNSVTGVHTTVTDTTATATHSRFSQAGPDRRTIVAGDTSAASSDTTTGNRVTGDYASTTQSDSTDSTTQTVRDTSTDTVLSTTAQVTTAESDATASGNRHDGTFTSTTDTIATTTIDRDGTAPGNETVTATLGSTSTDDATTTTTGNDITGVVSHQTTGTDAYSFTQVVDRPGTDDYTLTGSGTDTYSRTVDVNALTGETTSTATGTDTYTLLQSGQNGSGLYEVDLSGGDNYDATSSSNARTGEFTSTTTIAGTVTDAATSQTTAIDRVLSQSGNTIDSQTDQSVTGQSTAEGFDRYDALIDYLDLSDAASGTIGVTTTSPTGVPLHLSAATPVPTGGGREDLPGVVTGSIDTSFTAVTATLTNAAYRGVQSFGPGGITDPSDWTASTSIESYVGLGGELTDQYCFPAGTEVLLADGTAKPIEQIALGDRVAVGKFSLPPGETATTAGSIAREGRATPASLRAPKPSQLNPEPSQLNPGLVTQLHRNTTDLLHHIHLGDHTLTTTAGHPFWEATRGDWTLAADLLPGDRLIDADGVQLTVTAITTEPVDPTPIYNFAVAEHHQYHVRLPGTDHFVRVHNDSFGLNTYGTALLPSVVDALFGSTDILSQTEQLLESVYGAVSDFLGGLYEAASPFFADTFGSFWAGATGDMNAPDSALGQFSYVVGSFAGGLIDGAGNIVGALGSAGYELMAMVADTANAISETAGLLLGFDGRIYVGDRSQAMAALTSGEVSTASYYGNFALQLVTLGYADSIHAGYQYATGEITVDEASGRIGANGVMNLFGARVMRGTRYGRANVRDVPGMVVSDVRALPRTAGQIARRLTGANRRRTESRLDRYVGRERQIRNERRLDRFAAAERANAPSTTGQAAIRERVLSNIAASRASREASNFGGGLSFAPTKIPRKSVARLIAQRNQPRLSPADALAKGREVAGSFAGPIVARRGRFGEVFEAVSGSDPASLVFVTRGVGGLTGPQRRQLLALPVANTAENLNHVFLTRNQILLEGVVGPQQGGIFGPRLLPGGGFQAVTESGRFGTPPSVQIILDLPTKGGQ